MISIEEGKAFWVVWSPESGPPTLQHDSFDSAAEEAERLARRFPGHTFIVLQAIEARKFDAMQRIQLTGDDIPF